VPKPTTSPFLVPTNGSFELSRVSTKPPGEAPGKKRCKSLLKKLRSELADLQEVLYAHNKYSVLLLFQAMDAAGKDGTIRALLTGVNPAGCQVFSFKQPSKEELDHDFLWRTSRRLPERGRIGVFNRSYYEEVLVVRVHPEYLGGQRLPQQAPLDQLWADRFESIRTHEQHLANNGVVILKFWLNVSKEEQKNRFLSRLERPEKHWKFSSGDLKERGFWDDYQSAYEQLLQQTSRPWAPWYAIPADDKPYMRCTVADIVTRTLRGLPMSYPEVCASDLAKFEGMKQALRDE